MPFNPTNDVHLPIHHPPPRFQSNELVPHTPSFKMLPLSPLTFPILITSNPITSHVPASPPPEDGLQQQFRKFVIKSPCPEEAFCFQITWCLILRTPSCRLPFGWSDVVVLNQTRNQGSLKATLEWPLQKRHWGWFIIFKHVIIQYFI